MLAGRKEKQPRCDGRQSLPEGPKDRIHRDETFTITRWVCLATIVLGCGLSLTGPCRYWIDQDRDFQRTADLIHGDLSYLWIGPFAPIFERTLSGLFYVLLAPAMAISSRPEWLYTYLDLWVLAGLVPLWFLARFLTTAALAWVITALYAISSGRILYGHHGMHATVALTFGILWSLAWLRFLDRPSVRRGILGAFLLFVVLSLHLSYLPLLAAMPVMFVLYRRELWFSSPRARRFLVIGLAVGVVLAAAGVTGLTIWRGWTWWPKLLSGLSNAGTGVGEHAWFFAHRPTKSYVGWNEHPVAYLPVVALVLGGLFVLTSLRSAWAVEGGLVREDRRPLFRVWVICLLLFQLAAVVCGLSEWRTPGALHRYRHLTVLAPVIQTLVGVGLVGSVGWLFRNRRRGVDACVAGFVLLTAFGHAWAVVGAYRGLPWRIAGPAVLPHLQVPLARCQERWNLSMEWYRVAAFVEPVTEPKYDTRSLHTLPMQHRWRYLFEWSIRQSTSPGPTRTPLTRVLYFALPGSAFEEEILATQEIVDSIDTGFSHAYLCRRSARALLPLEPYAQFKTPWEYPWQGIATPGVYWDVEDEEAEFRLIATNIRPPMDLHAELQFEVVIEREDDDLVVGARLYGWQTLGLAVADNDAFAGPHVLVESVHGEEVRIDIDSDRFLQTLDRYDLIAVQKLQGWRPADVVDVRCGLDFYMDQSHHDEPQTATWSLVSATERGISK